MINFCTNNNIIGIGNKNRMSLFLVDNDLLRQKTMLNCRFKLPWKFNVFLDDEEAFQS